GTRPPTVDEWAKYDIHHRSRMSVAPGITGLWQVSGRSDITNFEEVVRLDLEYIEKWSLLEDLKLILLTVKVVILGSGAR
ncbi:MAG: sugar transferase, partial [Suipraeoptans sp.]